MTNACGWVIVRGICPWYLKAWNFLWHYSIIYTEEMNLSRKKQKCIKVPGRMSRHYLNESLTGGDTHRQNRKPLALRPHQIASAQHWPPARLVPKHDSRASRSPITRHGEFLFREK